MEIKKKWMRPTLFTIIGAVAGLLYYKFFGCSSGCMIASSPFLTAIYMAITGWLLSEVMEKEET